mmetsp:Transcript_11872/g.37146  ORF Transcript_11872/g.37146 Transcript_11872/m.37146 type:complete len:217 (+) Transcript_11872:281-931(+)
MTPSSASLCRRCMTALSGTTRRELGGLPALMAAGAKPAASVAWWVQLKEQADSKSCSGSWSSTNSRRSSSCSTNSERSMSSPSSRKNHDCRSMSCSCSCNCSNSSRIRCRKKSSSSSCSCSGWRSSSGSCFSSRSSRICGSSNSSCSSASSCSRQRLRWHIRHHVVLRLMTTAFAGQWARLMFLAVVAHTSCRHLYFCSGLRSSAMAAHPQQPALP